MDVEGVVGQPRLRRHLCSRWRFRVRARLCVRLRIRLRIRRGIRRGVARTFPGAGRAGRLCPRARLCARLCAWGGEKHPELFEDGKQDQRVHRMLKPAISRRPAKQGAPAEPR
ncbi:hypothetical protein JCM14124_23250 [Humidesulfovibrio idahonensis]